MKLTSLTIKSFRSIEDETFDIAEVDGTHTFTLIGINESGKSSFLKAVSLVDNDDEKVIFPKDYFEETQPISIVLNYELETQEEKDLKNALTEKGFEKDILSKIKIEKEAQGTVQRRCPDITKLRKLGFKPKVELRVGLKKTYEWYKKYFEKSQAAGGKSFIKAKNLTI